MEDFLRNKNLIHALKMISPGSPLRQGLDNILKAKTGGLIVIATGEEIMEVVDGGFCINAEYSPAYIYELAKMDGAIVLSSDTKKILFANAQLIPDYSISTSETGTRHRTAERVAKQTGAIVIAISQRRNIITVYRGDKKYALEDISKILTKANQALQTLEKYKSVLDEAIINLNALEFNDLVTIYDVAIVIQKIEMVMRITNIIEKYVIELGQEGTLADGPIPPFCRRPDDLQHPADRDIVAGQNVAFTGLSAFGTGENAICHIPHIHKVISAANGERQLPGKKGSCH